MKNSFNIFRSNNGAWTELTHAKAGLLGSIPDNILLKKECVYIVPCQIICSWCIFHTWRKVLHSGASLSGFIEMASVVVGWWLMSHSHLVLSSSVNADRCRSMCIDTSCWLVSARSASRSASRSPSILVALLFLSRWDLATSITSWAAFARIWKMSFIVSSLPLFI